MVKPKSLKTLYQSVTALRLPVTPYMRVETAVGVVVVSPPPPAPFAVIFPPIIGVSTVIRGGFFSSQLKEER